ncbi:putative glucuronosyltransferase [Helianthus debilis subsp. tardiflorus]
MAPTHTPKISSSITLVYLDADTIVVKNIDVLLKCGKFCANLKHSERLNSGVMVVEPSEEHFNGMVSKVTTLKSYRGGDQGFLNAYYTGFPSARVFDPNISTEEVNSKPAAELERLSALYNADVGLYMLSAIQKRFRNPKLSLSAIQKPQAFLPLDNRQLPSGWSKLDKGLYSNQEELKFRGSRPASCAFASKLVKVMVCWWLICKNNQRVEEIRQMCHVALKRDHEYIKTVEEGSEKTHTQVQQKSMIAPLDTQFSLVYTLLKDHIANDADYKVLGFCTTAMVTKLVADLLGQMRLNVREIHSRKSQSNRNQVSDEF